MNRRQSPISVASPNAVSVDTPRRQPSRPTTGTNGGVAAISMIAPSSRARPRQGGQHRIAGLVEGQLDTESIKAQPPQPGLMCPGPRRAVVEQSPTQQQLRQPMPSPHQVPADRHPSTPAPNPVPLPRPHSGHAPRATPQSVTNGPAVRRPGGRSSPDLRTALPALTARPPHTPHPHHVQRTRETEPGPGPYVTATGPGSDRTHATTCSVFEDSRSDRISPTSFSIAQATTDLA